MRCLLVVGLIVAVMRTQVAYRFACGARGCINKLHAMSMRHRVDAVQHPRKKPLQEGDAANEELVHPALQQKKPHRAV